MNPVEVSFVIPVRNGASTLEGCLQSIFAQKGQARFEIIVVDNGSRDGSADLARRLPEVLVLSEATVGRSHARNCGLSRAQGKWVAFIDCDVVLHECWLSEILASATSYDADGAQGKIIPKGKSLSLFEGYRQKMISQQTEGSFCHLAKRIFIHPMINTAACLYKRERLLEVGGFDPYFSAYEDVDLSWRLWCSGSVFVAVEAARSEVYWDKGGFVSYFKRSWMMGKESRRLHDEWGFPNTIFGIPNLSSYKSNWLYILAELMRLMTYKRSYQTRRVYESQESNEIYRKQRQLSSLRTFKFIIRDRFFCFAPGTRFLVTSDSLVIRQYQDRGWNTIRLSKSSTERTLLDIISNNSDDLVRDGILLEFFQSL